MRCAICSSVNRMRSIPGGSLLMASRLIASRSYLCSYFGGPLRQAVLEDQVFEILLIEDLHGQVRIQLPQQPDLAVLARHQRLFHGGDAQEPQDPAAAGAESAPDRADLLSGRLR